MEDIRANGGILYDSIEKVNINGVKGDLFPKNSIIVSTSATIGFHALVKTDFIANQRFTVCTINDLYGEEMLPKYLYYYFFLVGEKLVDLVNQGNFASVDMSKFKKIPMYIPSLEKQKQIVEILDKFDELVNSTKSGLNKEIELRQKQYEYWREKLLTF